MDEVQQTSLNCNKTNFFVCTTKRKSKSVGSFKITIGNHDIQSVEKVKYLGVTFCKQLSWIAHIDNIIKKLSRATRTFSTVTHHIDSESGQTNDFNIGIHSFPA